MLALTHYREPPQTRDTFVERAIRTLNRTQALPAFLEPDLTTGEYTSVEDRYRSEVDMQARNLFPAWDEDMLHAHVERQ